LLRANAASSPSNREVPPKSNRGETERKPSEGQGSDSKKMRAAAIAQARATLPAR
jgi:hypothetical protein